MLKRDTEIGLAIHDGGSSQLVVIPKKWCNRLDISPDDRADAEVDLEERKVTFHF